MRRTMIAILVILAVFSFVSCKKKLVCMDYAPSEKEVVWEEYNSVKRVNDNFRCYRASREEHLGDTLAVAGYSVDTNFSSESCSPARPDFSLILGDAPGFGWLTVIVPSELAAVLRPGAVKYYVVGTLAEGGIYDGGCCGYMWPVICAFSLDTVPHYELLGRQYDE